MPVLVRPFDWQHGLLSKLRPLPSDGRPIAQWDDKDAAWQDVARGVRQVVDEERRRPAMAPMPFPDGAELADAWRAGFEAAWAEVDEVLKRAAERRHEVERKRRRQSIILGLVVWGLWLCMVAWGWWASGTPPTSMLLISLMLAVMGVAEEVKRRRRERRPGLVAATRALKE